MIRYCPLSLSISTLSDPTRQHSLLFLQVIDYLVESPKYQMKAPGLTTVVEGHSKTLYMQNVKSIEERTKPNLKKTLKELGLTDGQELVVADVTTPSSLVFLLQISGNEA